MQFLVVFEKFTCAYLFQIALEIIDYLYKSAFLSLLVAGSFLSEVDILAIACYRKIHIQPFFDNILVITHYPKINI